MYYLGKLLPRLQAFTKLSHISKYIASTKLNLERKIAHQGDGFLLVTRITEKTHHESHFTLFGGYFASVCTNYIFAVEITNTKVTKRTK